MDKLVMFYLALTNRIAEITDKERGATATEYALLVALIAIAIVVAVTAFGSALSTFFTAIGTKV
ncbi:MAG TPA: Flp family type IVb pilin, partial [Jatrophihabitans sp.]|nr:Flp family type IVb pilin [Jatrophihabitans sp.]